MWIRTSFWYILILPAFGVISHVVSDYSNRPIFGQDGLLKLWNFFKKQTISVELMFRLLSLNVKNNTNLCFYYILVRIYFFIINNTRITKAQKFLYFYTLDVIIYNCVKHVSRNLRGHMFVINFYER